MKNSIYDRNGFHIVGIDNSLKAMQDGYIMYTEIYPPHAINGCTSMKAVVGKSEEVLNLYMEINGNGQRPAHGRAHTGKIGERRVGKECRSRWSPYH